MDRRCPKGFRGTDGPTGCYGLLQPGGPSGSAGFISPSVACVLIDREAPGRAQYELDMTLEEETTGKMGLTEFLVNGLRIQDAQYVPFTHRKEAS